MIPRNRWLSALACSVVLVVAGGGLPETAQAKVDAKANSFLGAMLSADQVTESKLNSLKSSGFRAIALRIGGGVESREAEREASARIKQAKLDLFYWVEVGRCPELADANPAWMASLQGHPEWRRLFKDPPTPRENEVVKTYPWVPILNKEPFQGQLARLKSLLDKRPPPEGVFLNDLQGAPSACGCGNPLCRWTTDYGKIRTTTRLGNDAAAKFVDEVQDLLPRSQIIPVWTTECEEHDGAKDGWCAGVGCYQGICWRAYTEQLMPVAKASQVLGVLLPYRALQRDLPHYGKTANWITHAVKTFETMPARYRSKPIRSARLIAVLQGWDVTDAQIRQQTEIAERAGVAGILVSYARIEQSWEPRIVKWK